MVIKNLKGKTHKLYRSSGSLWCRAVKDNVLFNKYGWSHLSFERGGKRRQPGNIKLRLHLFKYVHEIVKNAKFAIETSGWVLSKRGIRRQVKYYELVYWCAKEKCHISVVLRKIEEGKLHYYSVRRANSKIKKALAKAGLL
ncbi:MAG: hypothetical protein ABIJ05_02135 [Patescibacteria group bacterium]